MRRPGCDVTVTRLKDGADRGDVHLVDDPIDGRPQIGALHPVLGGLDGLVEDGKVTAAFHQLLLGERAEGRGGAGPARSGLADRKLDPGE